MATKSELLAELTSDYKKVGTPELQETYDFGGGDSTNWYLVNVIEVGQSEGATPIAKKRNIHFYVYNEGEVDEEAYYTEDEPTAVLDKVITTGTGSLSDLSKIYNSRQLRDRARIQIFKSAQAINWEDVGTANHAERLKWAVDALKDSDTYLDTFMGLLALDSTIQTNGVDSTDANIETVINSWIDFIAVNSFGA